MNHNALISARVALPPRAKFVTAAPQPPDDGVNQPNPGFTPLRVNAAVPDSGSLILEIELQPETASVGKSNPKNP